MPFIEFHVCHVGEKQKDATEIQCSFHTGKRITSDVGQLGQQLAYQFYRRVGVASSFEGIRSDAGKKRKGPADDQSASKGGKDSRMDDRKFRQSIS